MTATLVQAKSFLWLLLDKKTSSVQKKALLLSANDNQCKAIDIVIQNSLKTDLPVKGSDKRKISKSRKILKKISNKALSKKKKKNLIKKYYKLILVVLLIMRELLERILV